MGSNPVEGPNFFFAVICNCLNCNHIHCCQHYCKTKQNKTHKNKNKKTKSYFIRQNITRARTFCFSRKHWCVCCHVRVHLWRLQGMFGFKKMSPKTCCCWTSRYRFPKLLLSWITFEHLVFSEKAWESRKTRDFHSRHKLTQLLWAGASKISLAYTWLLRAHYWFACTVEPRYSEGPMDWQNLFAITRFFLSHLLLLLR